MLREFCGGVVGFPLLSLLWAFGVLLFYITYFCCLRVLEAGCLRVCVSF